MSEISEPTNYKNLFEVWQINLVEAIATRFSKGRHSIEMNIDDLQQELYLMVLKHKSSFKEDHISQATPSTYMYRILYRRALEILRSTKRKNRVVHTMMVSSESKEEESMEPMIELMEDMGYWKKQDFKEIQQALKKAFEQMTSEQKQICKWVKAKLTVKQIADKLGVHRDTIYERFHELREILFWAGFEKR